MMLLYYDRKMLDKHKNILLWILGCIPFKYKDNLCIKASEMLRWICYLKESRQCLKIINRNICSEKRIYKIKTENCLSRLFYNRFLLGKSQFINNWNPTVENKCFKCNCFLFSTDMPNSLLSGRDLGYFKMGFPIRKKKYSNQK